MTLRFFRSLFVGFVFLGSFASSAAWAAEYALAPLTAEVGSAQRGGLIVRSRDGGHCILCHAIPGTPERESGTIGPSLAGVGGRLNAGQLRFRIVNNAALNPETVMPAYHRVEGLTRVHPAFSGKPLLSAQAVEDVVAYLETLK